MRRDTPARLLADVFTPLRALMRRLLGRLFFALKHPVAALRYLARLSRLALDRLLGRLRFGADTPGAGRGRFSRSRPVNRSPREGSQSYLFPLPGEAVRVLFLFQNADLWPTWQSVWESACKRDDVTARLVLSPSPHRLGGAAMFDRARQFLIDNDVPFSLADSFSIDRYAPHVVILQTPYEELLAPFTSLDALRALGARIAYIPYGLDLGGGATNLGYQYDLRVQRQAWRIYARSPRHRRMFARYCRSGSGHVVVTGHPKLDITFRATGAKPRKDVLDAAGGRKVVLWTPHFSVVGSAWSTFLVYGEAIINWFETNRNLFLLIRPHPFFMNAMRESGNWNEQGEATFRGRLAASGTMMLDSEPDYRGSFEVADALMADAGSFLLEFLPTGKPIAYLSHPDGMGLSEEGDVTRNYFTVRSEEQVDTFLGMVSRGEDPTRELRQSAIEEYLGRIDGKSGERIVDDWVKGVRGGEPAPVAETVRVSEMLQSIRFWLNAKTTYLAPPEYYVRQEREIRALAERLPPAARFLDIGCGDGRFTRILAVTAGLTVGVDISATLIAQAKAASREDPSLKGSIEWLAQDANSSLPTGPFDRVACMGVTSALPSDIDFIRLIDDIAVRLSPGGILVMKDSLAISADRVVAGANGYLAKYRSAAGYFEVFGRRGFREVSRVVLVEDRERDLVNYLVVFEKPASP